MVETNKREPKTLDSGSYGSGSGNGGGYFNAPTYQPPMVDINAPISPSTPPANVSIIPQEEVDDLPF